MKKETKAVREIIKGVRAKLGLTQTALGKKVWPKDNPELSKVRIAKYELGYAMPPANIFLRIMRLPERKHTRRKTRSQ